MILIAHRGNYAGKKPDRENHPDYIDQAMAAGYHVEIDLRRHLEDLYLGHDAGDYVINAEWLAERSDKLWIHCKNFSALEWCSHTDLHYFWHENDSYTLTSKGYGWVFPGNPVYGKSIMVMPDQVPASRLCAGLCLDDFNNVTYPIPDPAMEYPNC